MATGVPEGVALMFWGHVLRSLGSFGLEGLTLRENGTPKPGHLFVIADLRRLDANVLPCRKGLPHKKITAICGLVWKFCRQKFDVFFKH